MAEAPESNPQPLLEEESIKIDGVPSRATFSDDGTLRWTDASGRQRRLAVEREVLGAEEVKETKTIAIRALVLEGTLGNCLPCGREGGPRRTRRDWVLEFPTEAARVAWATRLRRCLDSLDRPKNLFVFLNPYGGKKCAWNIFESEVKPLLEAANVHYTLQETEYPLHAQEVAHKMDLTEYDGIICLSGDGLLFEVLNGLLRREDWQSAIKMPLGIIPAGSGNGMAKSLFDAVGETNSATNAVFAIIRGHRQALDIATISQGKALFFSALMMCWGLLADIDIESEKFRWMGSARFEIYPWVRIINLRRYNGLVSFVPAPGYESYGDGGNRHDNDMVVHDDIAAPQQCGYRGPLNSVKSMEWRSIEGPFVSILLQNVPWISMDRMTAPEAKFSDGYYDMVIVKDCSRLALINFLTDMSHGGLIESPHVVYIKVIASCFCLGISRNVHFFDYMNFPTLPGKVKAFRLLPGHQVGYPMKGGIVDSDGEVLARGSGTYLCDEHSDPMKYGLPIEMQVEQGLATIFCPI